MSDAPIPDDILKSAFEIVEALESNKSGALTCSDARYATLLTNDANAIARALMAERERCANKAREFAKSYPQSSDGRNTFILLAEWIEVPPSAKVRHE